MPCRHKLQFLMKFLAIAPLVNTEAEKIAVLAAIRESALEMGFPQRHPIKNYWNGK